MILLIAFGSVAAMSLPIVTAVLGVIASMGAIELASHMLGVPKTATSPALMIGLGVGVVYSLFILTSEASAAKPAASSTTGNSC